MAYISNSYSYTDTSTASTLGFNNIKIRIRYENHYDITKNNSYLILNAYLIVDEGVANSNARFSIKRPIDPSTGMEMPDSKFYFTVNGTKIQFSLNTYTEAKSNTEYLLGTAKSPTYTHNADGSKSVACDIELPYLITNITTGVKRTVIPNYNEYTINLYTIPKVSVINYSTAYIGETAKISISKAASNFTDTITYTFGSLTGTIATKTDATSIDWVVPEEFYTVIPNATSKKGTLKVETFDASGASLGTNSVSFTVLVKESISKPLLENFIVQENNSDAIALTGDANILIKGYGLTEYSIQVTPRNGATIKEQYIQNGSKKIEGMPQGVIDDIESGTFTFTAIDSRGYVATATVEKTIVDYLKPTCIQEVTGELTGETELTVSLNIKGNYFNNTFGAAANTLRLEVRYGIKDEAMGDWTVLTGTPTFNGNTYELNATVSGLDYRNAYVFQCRAVDKLYTVQSGQYTIKIIPVFDWSEEDINFNVPIGMNNKGTVLRHNADANNTVLSGTGGHIYLRPAGTSDTEGEVIIYPDGSVNVSNSLLIAGKPVMDYVVDYGEEAMGTNGTWHWIKWASGKAECYGSRNFGNLPVTAAYGSMYRSSNMFRQYFPEKLFADIPDVIHAELDTRGFTAANNVFGGGFITQATPSESYTGWLTVVSPVSTTYSSTPISIHAIGRWEEPVPVTVWVKEGVTKDTSGAWYHWDENCPAFTSAGVTAVPLTFDDKRDIPSSWKLCSEES